MSTKHTHLARHFAATVTTTDSQTVTTALGPVVVPTEVYVPAGGELPTNLAEGQYERLESLGAFTPAPAAPSAGFVQTVDAQVAVGAEPGDVAREDIDQAITDVRRALDEADTEDDSKPASRRSK